jgi:integrase
MRGEITRARINKLKPTTKHDTWLWDSKISGFGVKVTPRGVKSYYFQYRMGGRGTPSRRLLLGRCEWTALETARNEAANAKYAVFQGIDPFETRKASEAHETDAGGAFEEIARDWWRRYSKFAKRDRGHREDGRIIDNILIPAFKSRSLASVTNADCEDFYHSFTATPQMGTRCLGVLRQIFDHGIKHFTLTTNPAKGIKRFKCQSRERHLSDDELRRFLSTLDMCEQEKSLSVPFIHLIRLLLFTGCRRDEIRRLQWEQVDLKDKSIQLLKTKTKLRTVYLNHLALDVLRSIQRLPKNPYVIPSPVGVGPLGSTSKPWAKLCLLAQVTDFRLHDLRHTYASFGINQDIPLYSVGKLLGHSRSTTTAGYAHLDKQPQRRATEMIAQHISTIMGEKSH